MATSETVSVKSIVQDATNCTIPWSEVAPDGIDEWFTLFAKAKGTCLEWFKEVVGLKRAASAPSMKRLLQCNDGSHWYETKGNANKRVGVPSAALALSCFTQLESFLRNVMPRLVANNNGLLHRFLILLPATAPVALSTRMDNSKILRNFNLSSFDRIYDKIYAKHNTGDQVKYSLSHEALDVNVRHMGENIPLEGAARATNSKDDKNIIRLAAVMHVLFSVINQALYQRNDDIPKKIPTCTMNAADLLFQATSKSNGPGTGKIKLSKLMRALKTQKVIIHHFFSFIDTVFLNF